MFLPVQMFNTPGQCETIYEQPAPDFGLDLDLGSPAWQK